MYLIGYIEDITTNYKVEDFLWSGSGDGDNETDVNIADEDVWWQYTTTIIQTTTVMWTSTATVYRSKHLSSPPIITTPVRSHLRLFLWLNIGTYLEMKHISKFRNWDLKMSRKNKLITVD